MKLKPARKASDSPVGHSSGLGAGRPDGATGLVIGAVGWLTALGLAGLLVGSLANVREEVARVHAGVTPAGAKLKAEVESRREGLLQEREELTRKINELVKRQEELLLRIQATQRAIHDLELDIKELERTKGELAGAAGALHEGQGLTGKSVAALEETLQGLERRRDRLQSEYKRRFIAMRADFEAATDAPEANALRQFYATHRDTAFGPAAGYHAAEKLYATKHSGDALRLYKEVVRSYPGSIYVEACKTRIQQIGSGAKFADPPEAIAFEPYLPEAGVRPSRAPAAAEPAAGATDAPVAP